MPITSSTKKVASKGLIKTLETKVNCSYTTEEERIIDKVLDGVVTCVIDSSEKVGDFLQFAGKVCLNSVYVGVDKQVGSERVETLFNDKIQVGDVEAISVIPKVKSVKQRRETSNFVDATITLLVEVYGVVQETISYVEPNNDSIVEDSRDMEVESLLCYNNTIFNLTDEIELPEVADRIITSYSTLTINKVTPNGNYVTVNGEVVRDIVYLVGDAIKRLQKRSDLSQEVSLLNCTEDTTVMHGIYLSDENYTNSTNDDQTRSNLSFSTNVCAYLWGFEKNKFNYLDDAFSTTRELIIRRSSFENTKHSATIITSESLSENIDMSDRKRIDEVVSIGSNNVSIESTAMIDGIINIGGKISQKIIGKNYDNDDIFTSEVEVPFNCQIHTGIEGDLLMSEPVIISRCTASKNKAGKELSLTYELNISVDVKETKTEVYIAECSEEGTKEQGDQSIVIYMPRGKETIFEIAKKLNVMPDVILSQNPGMSDAERIEKVIIFKGAK